VDTAVIVAIVIAALIIIGVITYVLVQRHRRDQLHDRFGPEYDRMVEGADTRQDRRAAEATLAERADRRDELDIRELDASSRARYAEQWQEVQARFVDQPGEAVRSADVLVAEVMRRRGYPVDDFETQADLVSVDHPDLVENYRAGHAISMRHDRNEATTEDLRTAFLHYRSLFDELLGTGTPVDDHEPSNRS
jgi:hypothetical protein